MKLTVTILACGLAAGLASAQSPSIIDNTRSTMNGVTSNSTAASNSALAGTSSATQSNPAGVATSADPFTTTKKHKARAKRTGMVAVPKDNANGATGAKDSASVKAAPAATTAESKEAGRDQETPANPKYNANGRRDPFISPVVSHAGGSGCSIGKKCLEIGTINLRGIVHSDNGFIAVVSNGVNKAYFLRENDPVFNGYVVKITGDSIVFQETLQDRLGKSFTREVVKKITTPAV